MIPPGDIKATRLAPSASGRVVKFRTRGTVKIVTACYKHLPIAQQRGGMAGARHQQLTGSAPSATDWIIQFGLSRIETQGLAARDQHLAISQHRGCVIGTWCNKIAGPCPPFRPRIVELGGAGI